MSIEGARQENERIHQRQQLSALNATERKLDLLIEMVKEIAEALGLELHCLTGKEQENDN